MPQFQVTTKNAEKVWEKGDLAIFKLTLDYQGQQMSAKTYSKTIANVGWSGTVETYEKQGRNGGETFVKQPPKEGGFQSQQGSRQSGYGGGGSKSSSDNYTMYLSYAKDIAIACITAGKFNDKLYDELIQAVEAGGTELYASRPDAPKTPAVTPEKSELDNVFGDTEVVEEETVWEEPPQLPVN